MSELDCPYLVRERITYRESLDLSRDARTRVITDWQCEHPFHGIAVDLGEVLGEVEKYCAGCRLPLDGAAAASSDSAAVPQESDALR